MLNHQRVTWAPMAEDAQIWKLTEIHVASNSRFFVSPFDGTFEIS